MPVSAPRPIRLSKRIKDVYDTYKLSMPKEGCPQTKATGLNLIMTAMGGAEAFKDANVLEVRKGKRYKLRKI